MEMWPFEGAQLLWAADLCGSEKAQMKVHTGN